jgi:hypothetical protein
VYVRATGRSAVACWLLRNLGAMRVLGQSVKDFYL